MNKLQKLKLLRRLEPVITGDGGGLLCVRLHPVPWRGEAEAEVASDPPSDPGQWSASTSPGISVLQPR